MPRYLLVIKAGYEEACALTRGRALIPVKQIATSFSNSMTYCTTMEVESDIDAVNLLNSWLAEDIDKCEEGKGFPVGSLLFWNPTMQTMKERRKENV